MRQLLLVGSCRRGPGLLKGSAAGSGTDGALRGNAASGGVYEGCARLVRRPADVRALREGDVLIAANMSAALSEGQRAWDACSRRCLLLGDHTS